jgi:hypothetical protein
VATKGSAYTGFLACGTGGDRVAVSPCSRSRPKKPIDTYLGGVGSGGAAVQTGALHLGPPPARLFEATFGFWWSVEQRQRSRILTSASGDAIWGAHRSNYIHGQYLGFFFVPQVPPAPRCTPVVISTKLTSRLSLAPCCACQPSVCHIQAAPRRALAPVESPPGLVIWPVTGTQTGRLPASLAKAFNKHRHNERANIPRAWSRADEIEIARIYRDESRRSLTSPSFR